MQRHSHKVPRPTAILLTALILLSAGIPGVSSWTALATHDPAPVEIVAGLHHTCARLDDASAWCWGRNSDGQLGDGTLVQRASPTPVSGLGNVVAIAAGDVHTCALLGDGTARCWGKNWYGQLGDGTTITRSTPVAVSGLSNAIALVAGDQHTCALLGDGTARCWGQNWHGQLGDGTTTSRTSPVGVSGLGSIVGLAPGGFHTCALLGDGSGRCWGHNGRGQLGDGTFSHRTTPVAVLALTDVARLAAGSGSYYSCAVLSGGAVKCWGENEHGQLGDGTTTARTTPTTVAGLSNAISLTMGGSHTCAALTDGTARCWGYNGDARLGDGTTDSPRTTPVPVMGLTGAIVVDGGYGHTCALSADAIARCWGPNYAGNLGDGTTTDRPTPVPVRFPVSPQAIIAPVMDAECLDGGRNVTLDGSASREPHGEPIAFEWSAPGIAFDDATSATPTGTFPLGSTSVTLTVTDPAGRVGTTTAMVRVVDTLPPTVAIARPRAGGAYFEDEELATGIAEQPILAVGSLTIVADAHDQCGVARVDFASTTGGAESVPTAPFTFVSDPPPTAAGPVNVSVSVVDLSGNTASAQVEFLQVGTAL